MSTTLDLLYTKIPQASNIKGNEFEFKYASLLYLRSINLGMKFKLATNDSSAGSFDDIHLRYETQNQKVCLMMQLKHKSGDGFRVHHQALAAPQGDFSINKYFESFCKIKQEEGVDTYFILLVNVPVELRVSEQSLGINTEVISKQSSIINTEVINFINSGGDVGSFVQFNVVEDADVSRYFKDHPKASDFLSKFILFSNQASENQLDELIKQEYILRFCKQYVINSDSICRELLDRVKVWWESSNSDKKNYYLTEKSPDWDNIQRNTKCEKSLLSQMSFMQAEVNRLSRHIFESDCTVLHIIYSDGSDIMLYSRKLIQALGCQTGHRFLLISTAETNDRISLVQKLWARGWCSVLVIAIVETVNLEQRTFVDEIRNTLNTYKNKKLVITSECSHYELVNYLKSKLKVPWQDMREDCKFRHLDDESQRLILDACVMFQGNEISIKSLNQSHIIKEVLNGEILSSFLKHEGMHTLTTANVPNYGMYIPRALERKIVIRKECFAVRETSVVFFVTGVTKKDLMCLIPSQEIVHLCTSIYNSVRYYIAQDPIDLNHGFSFLCMNMEGKQIHWLHKEGESFIWKQSYGNLHLLCQYAEVCEREKKGIEQLMRIHKSCSLSEESVLQVGLRAVLVVGEPGMGKSVMLSYMLNEMKTQYHFAWVLKINLNECSKILNDMKLSDITIDDACRFLNIAANISGSSTCPELTASLFHDGVKSTGNAIVFLDAFDEISSQYKDIVLSMVKVLLTGNVSTICIASRCFMQEELEKALSTQAFVLKPFTYKEKLHFLIAFLKSHNTTGVYLKYDMLLNEQFVKVVHGLSISGSPLYMNMLAELYVADNSTFSTLNVIDVYKKFIDIKFELFFKEKMKMDISLPGMDILINILHATLMKHFKICSVWVLDLCNKLEESEKHKMQEKFKSIMNDMKSGILQIGIIDSKINGLPHFIHRTFAEYFAAHWFAEHKDKNLPLICQLLFEPRLNFFKEVFDNILVQNCPLHLAVINRDHGRVKNVLSQGVNSLDTGGRTPLHLAVQGGSILMVELLLNHAADWETKDNILGCTPIYYSVKVKNWDAFRLLWKQGVQVENNIAKLPFIQELLKEADQNGYCITNQHLSMGFEINWPVFDYENISANNTILHVAVKCGKVRSVQMLTAMGAEIEFCDSKGHTPLQMAVDQQNEFISRVLLDNGANVKCIDVESCISTSPNLELVKLLIDRGHDVNGNDFACSTTILMEAARKGNVDLIEVLLEKGADVNMRDCGGMSALHYAVKNNQEKIVEALLVAGADVCEKDDCDDTALHHATLLNCKQIAKLLVQNGADIQAKNRNGNTPLHFASMKKDVDVLNMLMKYGEEVDVNIRNAENETALHYAAVISNLETIILLMQNGADVNIPNINGNSPLLHAFCWGSSSAASILLAGEGDVTVTGWNHMTCLHFAVENKDVEKVKLLLTNSRIDINAQDLYGDTPLHIACCSEELSILKLLCDHKADLTIKNKGGNTALDLAIRNGCSEMVSELLRYG